MNEVGIKEQLYILIGAILLIYFFADSFLLGNQPRMISSMKSQLTQLENNQKSLESLQRDKKSLEDDLEESRSSLDDLFVRFPNHNNTENDRSAMIANITQRLIVQKEQLIPKFTVNYVGREIENQSVPKVLDEDKDQQAPKIIQIVNYKSIMELRANYFELLEFFHELANQDMFFLPTLIDLKPDEEVPYGIEGKVELLTFGFGGFKPEDSR